MSLSSLKQSDILSRSDLAQHNLGGPIRLQRYYSSRLHGLETFFGRLKTAVETFQRLVLVLRVSPALISFRPFIINWFVAGSSVHRYHLQISLI